jgi:hypothetical protein
MKKNVFISTIIISLLAIYALLPRAGSKIPPGADYENFPAFIGSPFVPQPLAPIKIPVHPHLAAQGINGMHSDSYNTESYPWSGPLGNKPVVASASFGLIGGECTSVVFDKEGRLFTVCVNFFEMRLIAMNAETLQIIAMHNLPLRDSNKTLDIDEIQNDSSGGAYFHLDNHDRAIIANADRHIQILGLHKTLDSVEWNVFRDIDLNPYLPEASRVTDAIPDWLGNIWFVTRKGIVGVVNIKSGSVKIKELIGEEFQNAIAVAEDGVYIVSDHALYSFRSNPLTDEPEILWREIYDRGTKLKPGAINQGSGTTPTLMRDDLVTITDNADSQINVMVYRRTSGDSKARVVCKIPVFKPKFSVTENSLIVYDRSIIVENNFGYTTPFKNPKTEPGVTRIDVREDLSGCDIVWQSLEASLTTVPKLSIGNGLIYLYTRDMASEKEAWYFTAIDFATGQTQFKIHTGNGRNWNNNWAPITLGKNGHAYIGVLRGIVSIADSKN